MKIVLVGGGGREHALAWKLAQNKRVEEIVVIPGSSGMIEVAEYLPVEWDTAEELADIICSQQPDLVIIGNEAPLEAGIVDILQERKVTVFGPTKAAARIETSKSFAKHLFTKYRIPTASYGVFIDPEEAIRFLEVQTAPYVIKADGLAAGKGVVIAATREEAEQAIIQLLKTGERIVIEEFMEGEEASLLAFVDGETVVPMIAAQDHKRLLDDDAGPNTGGMGAYAPAAVVTPEIYEQAVETILKPTAAALVREGCPFRGVLYAGLMITAEGPKVVEFNCRFGDPETQVLMPLLDSDLTDVILQICRGEIAEVELSWLQAHAVCVVLASFGYPRQTYTGDVIRGLMDVARRDALVFHAGTRYIDGKYYTDGGRVLNVVAVRPNLRAAKDAAYAAVSEISFDGMQYRTDIADKELKKSEEK
ncbi:MAG: phosphoribosylamine--glycine ligase [Veillonellaceae bacterium]|nr:phosphoribosylamine--glycine ligase [Veillonellaceae bacterium]